MKLYICIHDDFPDYMTPTLVAHAAINAHLSFKDHFNHKVNNDYQKWLNESFKKCVVRVNQKEFDKIRQIPFTVEQYEKHTMDGQISCLIPPPMENDFLPNVLKFAKLWKPK